jgi:hypothetical protein
MPNRELNVKTELTMDHILAKCIASAAEHMDI